MNKAKEYFGTAHSLKGETADIDCFIDAAGAESILELDADAMTASVSGKEIPVTTREFNIMYKLLSYPNKTLSRAQLMDEFWGVDSDTSLRAVDVYITKLRDKFADCDGFEIKTVRGLGYKAVLV